MATGNSGADPAQGSTAPSAAPARRWRGGAVLAFAAAGALFATTALSSNGLDLRASSITDLDQVVRQERARADELQARVAALNADVEQLGRGVDNRAVTRLRRQIDALRSGVGFGPVRGPGLSVVLTDAPKSEIDSAAQRGLSPEELVVHQQDIQAVVNALWAGGAEAMTIQNQRVIATTGIKCVGNTVVLHGVPYSPPYVIAAIGDPAALQASLDASDYIAAYLTFVRTNGLGYAVVPSVQLEFPAYTGSTVLKYAQARPVTPAPR